MQITYWQKQTAFSGNAADLFEVDVCPVVLCVDVLPVMTLSVRVHITGAEDRGSSG